MPEFGNRCGKVSGDCEAGHLMMSGVFFFVYINFRLLNFVEHGVYSTSIICSLIWRSLHEKMCLVVGFFGFGTG